jgi:dTDP-4-amino-4,6-dideoxygalactose transaminase
MSVPLLDLRPQYDGIKAELNSAVARVIESQHFILGPEVDALEDEMAEFLGVRHAIGCASGTDALLLSLKALNPVAGDEAILPAFTFFATAGAAWNAGFRPVFCDIDPVTFNVTPETVEEVWSDRTRVVIAVHLFGQMAPMSELKRFVSDRGCVLLEDAAQSIGAQQVAGAGPGGRSVMAGAAGDAGAFSFFPTKNLGGFGDGGLVSTSDADLAARVRKLRVHGGKQMYRHEMVGTNSRLDAIQAAVLRAKLPYLEGWTGARRVNASRYHEALDGLEGIRLPETMEGNVHVYNQYTIRADKRDELQSHLRDREIGAGVYYPIPLHLQECFSELGGRKGQLPEVERACSEVLSLPIFPELGEKRQAEVSGAITDFYR